MQHLRPTILAVILADLCALLASFGMAYLLRQSIGGFLPQTNYFALLPIIVFFIPLYAAFGLYPGLLLAAPEQLKRFTIASSIGVLFISGIFFVGQIGTSYSRLFLFFFWLIILITLPLLRYTARKIFGKYSWWGYPVLFFGNSNITEILAKHLKRHPELGYKTLGILNIDESTGNVPGVETETLEKSFDKAAVQLGRYQKKYPLITAVLVMEGLDKNKQKRVFKWVNSHFRRLIIMPDESFDIKLSVTLSMFCSRISLSMRQNLLDPYRLYMKRFLDLLLVLIFAGPLLLLFLALSVIIRLDSSGSVLYRHKRVGQRGKELNVWKFRTMYKDADAKLQEYLAGKPEMAEEWRKVQKLRHDPRITRVGRCLRKFSLDELPQLINVLTGDMSLVGPRPIVESEIERYSESFEVYKQVKPGITGLWQVSGRNNTSYETRVMLDETYIANWSVWLDIYILIRTIPAAVTADGAY